MYLPPSFLGIRSCLLWVCRTAGATVRLPDPPSWAGLVCATRIPALVATRTTLSRRRNATLAEHCRRKRAHVRERTYSRHTTREGTVYSYRLLLLTLLLTCCCYCCCCSVPASFGPCHTSTSAARPRVPPQAPNAKGQWAPPVRRRPRPRFPFSAKPVSGTVERRFRFVGGHVAHIASHRQHSHATT